MSETATTSKKYEFEYRADFSKNIIKHYQALEKQVGNYAENDIIKDIHATLKTAAKNFINDDVLNAYNQTPYTTSICQEKTKEVSPAYLATKTLLHTSYFFAHSVSETAYILLSFLKLFMEYVDNLVYSMISDPLNKPHILQTNTNGTDSSTIFRKDIEETLNHENEQIHLHIQKACASGYDLLKSNQKQTSA